MRLSLLILGIVLGATAIGTRAQAQNYPWCAQYGGGDTDGGQNCGFTTLEQCMATVSGIGGSCVVNNLYVPPHGSRPQARRNSHKQS
jgi:Protein of unknown function (DUF3551)